MTSSTLASARFSNAQPVRSSGLSLRGFLDVLSKALAMHRAIPELGGLNARQMEKLKAIASTI